MLFHMLTKRPFSSVAKRLFVPQKTLMSDGQLE